VAYLAVPTPIKSLELYDIGRDSQNAKLPSQAEGDQGVSAFSHLPGKKLGLDSLPGQFPKME
jgi:hypothetical protein